MEQKRGSVAVKGVKYEPKVKELTYQVGCNKTEMLFLA